jgi:hypothetical protein
VAYATGLKPFKQGALLKMGCNKLFNVIKYLTLIGLISTCAKNPVKIEKETGWSLIYTANRHGEIEPCGCQVNQLGGFPRWQNFFERKKTALAETPLIFVDAGDSFFPSPKIAPSREIQEKLKSEVIFLKKSVFL